MCRSLLPDLERRESIFRMFIGSDQSVQSIICEEYVVPGQGRSRLRGGRDHALPKRVWQLRRLVFLDVVVDVVFFIVDDSDRS